MYHHTQAPAPADDWQGIRDATKHGSICISKDFITGRVSGTEDCLFINVYTPNLPTNGDGCKPVMCWVPGGGFVSGSGNADLYGPEYLVTEDVVLVTFNYRVGLLGFLNFSDPSLDVPGNAGLKDQIMALKWIQENIANFGGDPHNVTIFGESAGGASVHLLILSPLAKGLFHKAIMQSGVATAGWSRGQATLPILKNVLSVQATEKQYLEILQQMSFDDIIQLQMKIPNALQPSFFRPFGPVIENVPSNTAFLTKEPLEIMRAGTYNQVPIIMGYTSREGMVVNYFNDHFYNYVADRVPVDFELEIPFIWNVPKGSSLSMKLAEEIKSFYFGSEKPSQKNRNRYYQLQGDSHFTWPLHFTLSHFIDSHSSTIYIYRMSVDTELNLMKKVSEEPGPGVCHADDLGYLFMNPATLPPPEHSTEMKTVKRFIKLWANFARTGNPNSKVTDSLISVLWKPVEKDRVHFLEIGENLTVGVNPDEDRIAFWWKLFRFAQRK
ncbi:esterase B1-like isoform X2 [Photinus pyralis]|uniref:esterase B1-like isoform X2 n=1 Tax=Photinus pyralis TaxID=7054 RepID=UPI00126740E5|nr:esterase B1-like isoform X2 [Photinus pyralis]